MSIPGSVLRRAAPGDWPSRAAWASLPLLLGGSVGALVAALVGDASLLAKSGAALGPGLALLGAALHYRRRPAAA